MRVAPEHRRACSIIATHGTTRRKRQSLGAASDDPHDDGPPPRAHPAPHEVLIGVGEEDRHCINAPICPLFQIPFVFPNETMSLRRNCVIAVRSLPSSHCVHRCLAWPSRLIIRTMQRDNTLPLCWTRHAEGFFPRPCSLSPKVVVDSPSLSLFRFLSHSTASSC